MVNNTQDQSMAVYLIILSRVLSLINYYQQKFKKKLWFNFIKTICIYIYSKLINFIPYYNSMTTNISCMFNT